MISVRYWYCGEMGVQLDGEKFCTSVGVDLYGGKFKRKLGKPGNSLSGNYADWVCTISVVIRKTGAQYSFGFYCGPTCCEHIILLPSLRLRIVLDYCMPFEFLPLRLWIFLILFWSTDFVSGIYVYGIPPWFGEDFSEPFESIDFVRLLVGFFIDVLCNFFLCSLC